MPACVNIAFLLDSVLKPKARTGISKPYNVKQIKTTNAQEAEAAIRCLLEARGGEWSAGVLLLVFSLPLPTTRDLEEKVTSFFLEAVLNGNTL